MSTLFAALCFISCSCTTSPAGLYVIDSHRRFVYASYASLCRGWALAAPDPACLMSPCTQNLNRRIQIWCYRIQEHKSHSFAYFCFFLALHTSFIRRYLLIIWYDSIFIALASTFTSETLACGGKDFVNFPPSLLNLFTKMVPNCLFVPR